jgi:hypothetical protein
VIVEGLSQESRGYPIQGRFLYADYTPLDDNRNIIEMLKDFVSLTGKLTKLQTSNDKLASTLRSSESIRLDVLYAIKQIRTSTGSSLDWFRNKHRDALATELDTSSAALLGDTGKTISDLLGSTEAGFEEEFKKYTGSIMSRISDNHIAAATFIQTWLSSDHKNLPISMLASLSTEMTVSIDPAGSPKKYIVYRNTLNFKKGARDSGQNRETNASGLNYKFRLDTSDIEFWDSGRKVSDFGIKELMLPVGMKAPISEKLKHAFRLGSKKDSDPIKEPEFVKVDDYYLLSAKLDQKKTLSIQLVPDIAKPQTNLLELFYHVDDLPSSSLQSKDSSTHPVSARPRIDFTSNGNGQYVQGTDLLQIKEIARASDLTKIGLLGTAILDKMGILQNPSLVSSRGKLELLKADEKNILLMEGTTKVEFTLLFELLNSIATYFTPFVKRLKEKTPIKGELILREEVEKGQRKEFTIRLDELRSQLDDSHYCGKTVSEILQL